MMYSNKVHTRQRICSNMIWKKKPQARDECSNNYNNKNNRSHNHNHMQKYITAVEY